MAEPSPAPPASTFVVRFWRLRSAGGAGWGGHIEHVQSGGSSPFLTAAGMMDFIRAYGILLKDGEDTGGDQQTPA